ncbi:hypothetical protein MANES_18G085550v8 [Manihot esculenta]|uniref:Uncharacterized protein n=1 Tax=Manihot esculenta TaxID=3983 RepID=A0ACB7G0F4_MANES|nr:hypothetical protein MANES_18G085550v8 [Manihot esculenta]
MELQSSTTDDSCPGCNMLPFHVRIELVTVFPIPEQECSSRVGRAVQELGGVLQKGRFNENWNLSGQCVMCLEDLSVGWEVSVLQRSHIFHQDFTFKSLQRSCMCPLCCYHFPFNLLSFGWVSLTVFLIIKHGIHLGSCL